MSALSIALKDIQIFLKDRGSIFQLLLLPLIFIVAACNQAAAPGDPSEITARSEMWEASLNAKDIDGVVALYTSDARLMPPNAEMTTGQDAVRAALLDTGGNQAQLDELLDQRAKGYQARAYFRNRAGYLGDR